MKFILITILFVLCSCKSPSKAIAQSATEVSSLAQESKGRFQRIEEATKTEVIDVPSIQQDTQAGVVEQERIITLTKVTLVALTQVEDEVPWWASVISYTMVTLSIIAICFILWYTGIGSLIKSICYSFGLFIPRDKLVQAEVARKSLDEADPATPRESVAVMRASDPAFNAAYKKISKKEKLK